MGHLKHWFIILCAFTLLTACSEKTSVESTSPIEKEIEVEKETEEKVELSVEEILHKSIEAMNNVNSLATEMNMVQEMSLPNEENYSTNMLVYMEITQQPLNMYQKITMDLPEVGEVETELYMLDNAFYYKDPMEEKWFSYPEDIAAQLREMENTEVSTDEQLQLLLTHTEELTYTEDETHYIISVEGESDLLQSFAQELNGIVHENMSGDIDQLMLMADIKELSYSLYIDKETFKQTKMDMTMSFELQTDGESVLIHTSTEATFLDYNGISEIIIPADVIESAEEYNPDYSGIEDWEEIDLDEEEEEAGE